MSRVVKYKPLYPWSGGLNTSIDPVILDPQYLVEADNIIFTNSGSRKKRPGQARYNTAAIGGTAAENVVFLFDYWATVSNAKREYFVALTESGKAYRSLPSATTWSSFCTSTLTVSHGGVTGMVMNEDLILGIQGSGVPKIWDNQSTSSNLVTMTATGTSAIPFSSAWIVMNFLERGWYAGDPANPDKIYISQTGTYNNFTAGSTAGNAITLNVGIGDGDPGGITAMCPSTGGDRSVYVFKRTGIYKINCSATDQTTWTITRISNTIGCINQNTIATIDMQDIFFLSDRGLHSLNQVISGTAIVEGDFLSAPIQYDYKEILNNGVRTKISGVYMPSLNSYLFSCRRDGVSTFETVYGYNLEVKSWFRWTSVPCNFLMKRLNTTTGEEQLYAAASSGRVNKLLQSDLNDFGSAIVTRIKSAFIAPEGLPFADMQYTNLACVYRSRDDSSFRVYYSVDGLTTQSVDFEQRFLGGNVLGSSALGVSYLLGSIQSIKPVWNHLTIGEGASLQLTFEQDGIDEDFELFGVVLEYEGDGEAQNAFLNPAYS